MIALTFRAPLPCRAYTETRPEQMLEAGADPNEQALDGTQPLSMAAGNWSTKYSGAIVHSLIRAGANPDAFCGKGFLPLHTACTTGGDESIVLALLDGAGTAVDAPCPGAFFNRPLHLAAYHGHADVVRVLASVDGCRLNEKAPHYRWVRRDVRLVDVVSFSRRAFLDKR